MMVKTADFASHQTTTWRQ